MAQPQRVPQQPTPQQQYVQRLAQLGDRAFDKNAKVSAEFVAISYGCYVKMLLDDAQQEMEHTIGVGAKDQLDIVNQQLLECGIKIGQRVIDEFLAKSGAPVCKNFMQTSETIAKVGLKMYLGIVANVDKIVDAVPSQTALTAIQHQGGAGAAATATPAAAVDPKDAPPQTPASYSLIFDENPLIGFASLPEEYKSRLWYSNVLCGVIVGALEQIGIRVTARYVKDTLRGDNFNEIRVEHVPTLKRA